MNLPKLEIWFCAIGLATILLLRFAVLDNVHRHERRWREFSMLASLSQRQHMYEISDKFFKAAIGESEQISGNDIRLVFSLSDYARLLYRKKKYTEAIGTLERATALLQVLEKHSEGVQADLTKGEDIRIHLLKAQIYSRLRVPVLSRSSCLQALEAFASTSPDNPDLIDVIRAKESFVFYCQESCKVEPTRKEIQDLLSKTRLCRRFKYLPPTTAGEMAEHFEGLLEASPHVSDKERQKQVKMFLSCLPSNDQSTEAGSNEN